MLTKNCEKNKIKYLLTTLSSAIRSFETKNIWMIAILLYFLDPSFTLAQNFKSMVEVQSDKTPWNISADTMSYDPENSLYKGTGHVIIERGATRLTASEVMFNPTAMLAEAKGDVVLKTAEDRVTCQRIELDLNAETGTLYQSSVFIGQGHYHIKGDKIQKTGEASYFADKATVTTCDGENPDWKLTARKLNITIEGYGTAYHTALWAKSVPLLYSPFLVFPIKIRRQTGLISPHLGFSSRKGVSYEQPFFWAINDQSDMTFTYNYMEKRGNQYGMQYRYFLGSEGKGMMMFDWLDDAKVDANNSDSFGYTDDSYLRPDNERYWFRMKHDQPIFTGFTAKLDLDIVSDQDYLPEFKSTLTGFNESQKAFEEFTGRSLDDYTDISRKNTASISKTWTSYNLSAGVNWTDYVPDYYLNGQKTRDTSVQYLPSIDFDGSKHRLAKTPLYFTLSSQYTYLYREELPTNELSSVTQSQRMDAYPRIFLPFNWDNYLSIEPSLGLRETLWYATEDDEILTEEREVQNRELWDVRLDLSNAFYRIYKSDFGLIDRIKHDIKPSISYQYLPRVDQDEYPYFDIVDRIPSKNLITYSLTNVFTYRKQPPARQKNDDSGENSPAPFYHQFARLKLEQSYDLSDGNDPYQYLQYNLYEDDEDDGIYYPDYPFSELYSELEITPATFFSIRADGKWSFYDNQFKTGNLAFNLWDQRGDRLKVEYRYAERTSSLLSEDNTKESFITSANLKLTNQINLFGLWERDLYTDTELEYGGGLIYSSQCWSFEASNIVEGSDHRYLFIVELFGLGKIGT